MGSPRQPGRAPKPCSFTRRHAVKGELPSLPRARPSATISRKLAGVADCGYWYRNGGVVAQNLEAAKCGALCECSRAAGSQQSSRARRELSQRAALRPRLAWPAPPPSWPLLAVCAAAHMQARGALRTIAPIQCLPPCLYAFRRGARDDARGSRSRSGVPGASTGWRRVRRGGTPGELPG